MSSTRRLLAGAALLIALWLGLRGLLLLEGGSPGEALDVRLNGHAVSALLLRAKAERTPRPLVIALHGGLAAKETLLALCWEALRRGADCATLDALGHGQSGRLPHEHAISAMRSALHIEQALGVASTQTYFIGHSMGAHLGCGTVFPCERCVAIGQPVSCDERRIVYGTVHAQLGLSHRFYLPISHVLEPWTPSVIESALDRLLPQSKRENAAPRIRRDVLLAWGSLGVMALAAVLLARIMRAQAGIPAALRGALAALVILSALAIASYRALWWLVPTQRADALIALALIAAAWLAAHAGKWLGLRHPGWGVLFAALLSEYAAVLCYQHVPIAALRGLLRLPLGLLLPVILVVALWERLSRTHRSSAEAAVFAAVLLGGCLALLVPGF